jgi:hypothetical protein
LCTASCTEVNDRVCVLGALVLAFAAGTTTAQVAASAVAVAIAAMALRCFMGSSAEK